MSRTVSVREVAKQIRGVTFTKDDASPSPHDGLVPVLRAGNIQDGHLVLDDLVYVPADRVRDAQRVRRDDVVIAASSGSRDVIGKAARCRADFSGGFGAFLKVLRPGPGVDPGYFSHFFQTHEYRRRVSVLAAGANINNLKNEHLDDLEIPLPSLNEQRRIAAILDNAEELRAKRRQVLAHLDTLTQSIFHDMFGGIPGSVPLRQLVEGFRYGTSNKSGDLGYPTLRIPNVIDGSLNLDEIKTVEVTDAELERLRLRRGDLLFVRTNGNPDNVGRCAVFEPDMLESTGHPADSWIYASYLIRGRLADEYEPDFIATFIATPAGRRQLRERSKTSAGQYNINIDGLGDIQIPDVPADAQRVFVKRLKAVRSAHRLVDMAALDELFASLQSRAFRGEL